jgi:divalent metal cation (Fe/Co/Zn/Cd) transporter
MGALSDIMDEKPSPELYTKIFKIVTDIEGIKKINGMKVRKSGLNYLVDINVEIDGNITVYEGHVIAETVTEMLCKSSLPILEVMVHIEPDNKI